MRLSFLSLIRPFISYIMHLLNLCYYIYVCTINYKSFVWKMQPFLLKFFNNLSGCGPADRKRCPIVANAL